MAANIDAITRIISFCLGFFIELVQTRSFRNTTPETSRSSGESLLRGRPRAKPFLGPHTAARSFSRCSALTRSFPR